MTNKRKNKDWTDLINIFSSLSQSYATSDARLHDAISAFCQKLKTENISHASITTSGKVWGAKSLVLCFCEIFDPMLIEIFHSKSFAYQYLQKQQVTIPLLNQMQYKEDSKAIADAMDRAISQLESLIPIEKVFVHSAPPSDWEAIQRDTENLQLIARLVSAIYSELGYERDLKWCAICFRVAKNASSYCQVHSSSLNDTAYRRFLKAKHTIPSELQKSFQRRRSLRQALGNTFRMISELMDVPATIEPDIFIIRVDGVLKNLVLNTQNMKWSEIAREWDLVLDTLPHVRKRHKKNPLEFISWQEFANYTKSTLQNLDDNTTHPYWIFIMLAEAEQWFTYEDRLTQEKTKQKKDQILEMISQSLRNRDIVNQLQVSNSYVSGLRKQYNKNRTSN